MQLLSDWEQFRHSFHRIKRNNSGYSTNLYAGKEQVESWLAHGQLFCLSGHGADLFLRRDRDFHHVFHVAASSAALTSALKGAPLPPTALTVDLVGTPDALAPWIGAYRMAGYAAHTTLCRMSKSGPASVAPVPEEGVEQAGPEDAAAIVAFFERLLDRHAEQLPSIDEVAYEARQGRVLLVRRGNAPCGVLIFALKGKSAQLRYWHVDEQARGQGTGSRLMRQFLAHCRGAARIVLWVKANNTASLSIYRYYGFETDTLVDEIMIKTPIENHE
ncbi:MAG TPA: GNAT family N-acetyltransferase [Noviherbaspirillum sp.]